MFEEMALCEMAYADKGEYDRKKYPYPLDCFYPRPYPNGKVRFREWEIILAGGWGDAAKSAARNLGRVGHGMRVDRVHDEMYAIEAWTRSEYAFSAPNQISVDSMYDHYLAALSTAKKPVCRSVSLAFFAKSIAHNKTRGPRLNPAGDFCYPFIRRR